MMSKILFALAMVGLFAQIGIAESLPVTPGLWEFETTTPNFMNGQTSTRTNRKCFTQTNYDPQKDADSEFKGCTISDENLSGNTLTWTMNCESNGMKQKVVSTYTMEGETMSGSNEMTMSGPMNMTMKITHKGRRIGDCP